MNQQTYKYFDGPKSLFLFIKQNFRFFLYGPEIIKEQISDILDFLSISGPWR